MAMPLDNSTVRSGSGFSPQHTLEGNNQEGITIPWSNDRARNPYAYAATSTKLVGLGPMGPSTTVASTCNWQIDTYDEARALHHLTMARWIIKPDGRRKDGAPPEGSPRSRTGITSTVAPRTPLQLSNRVVPSSPLAFSPLSTSSSETLCDQDTDESTDPFVQFKTPPKVEHWSLDIGRPLGRVKLDTSPPPSKTKRNKKGTKVSGTVYKKKRHSPVRQLPPNMSKCAHDSDIRRLILGERIVHRRPTLKRLHD